MAMTAQGLAEGRELNRRDLDAILPDHPVMCIHVSNHGGVLNSLALKTFDISAATMTPPPASSSASPARASPPACS